MGFDAQIYRLQRQGGIRRYFSDLASHLPQAGIRVSQQGSEKRNWFKPSPWYLADVVHPTFYSGVPYRLAKQQALVSSLHDMTPERHPEYFFLPALRSPHANKAVWLAASDLIISVSAASADDLIFFNSSLKSPTEVIHLATSIHKINAQQIDRLVGCRFWLMVGKRHAYKNALTLLKALSCLRSATDQPKKLPFLVFAGGGPWRSAERQLITNHRLEQAVIQLDVSNNMLAWLYHNAEAVFVPSLAEGFSLPLIEALACDTPVVASDLEVHREVGAGFATFLSPLNTRLWTDWLDAHSAVPCQRPSVALGSQEYERLCNYYSIERMITQHINSYQALV